jgi:hypothetical protein
MTDLALNMHFEAQKIKEKIEILENYQSVLRLSTRKLPILMSFDSF